MNKKRIALFSCAALVASGIGLNIQNALSDYGIGENSFSLVAVGPGSNSGSNSNSNSNWNSNTNTDPLDQSDSDDNGVIERKFKLETSPCEYKITGGTPNQWIHWTIGSSSGSVQLDATGYAKIDHEESYLQCIHDQSGDLTVEQCRRGETECPDLEF